MNSCNTEAELLAMRKHARRKAFKKGFQEYADDFASYCTIKQLSREDGPIMIWEKWGDFYHHTFGNSSNRTAKLRLKSTRHYIPVLDDFDEDDDSPIGTQVMAPFKKDSLCFEALADRLGFERQRRQVFMLYFGQNYEPFEVGLEIGLSRTGVFRNIKAICKIIKEKIGEELAEINDSYDCVSNSYGVRSQEAPIGKPLRAKSA